ILTSSLNGGNTGQSSGNWHPLSRNTGIRLKTVLGVVVRAMSNGGYLLLKNPRTFRSRSVNSLDEMRLLYAKVKTKIKLEEDNVRFYWLSPEAASNALTLGSKPPEAPPTYYVL
ncbi:hypothetical protein PMG71_05590, partial [Roseofilum sp. BLCC_M154]